MPAKNSAAVESVISALRNHVVLLCAAADTPQQSARITVAPDQLLGNTRYRLSVEARTPGSDVGSSDFEFWVAQEPFGGSCIVTSSDGECMQHGSSPHNSWPGCHSKRFIVTNTTDRYCS